MQATVGGSAGGGGGGGGGGVRRGERGGASKGARLARYCGRLAIAADGVALCFLCSHHEQDSYR